RGLGTASGQSWQGRRGVPSAPVQSPRAAYAHTRRRAGRSWDQMSGGEILPAAAAIRSLHVTVAGGLVRSTGGARSGCDCALSSLPSRVRTRGRAWASSSWVSPELYHAPCTVPSPPSTSGARTSLSVAVTGCSLPRVQPVSGLDEPVHDLLRHLRVGPERECPPQV